MTEKEFARAFRRGLGSAIVELKKNEHSAVYRDRALRYCLRDIAYDPQVEGTKGYYLYTAIKTFEEPIFFLDQVIEIIYDAIKKATIIPCYNIQRDINDIYTRHRSSNAFPALFHVYQKGECAHCRYDTVKAMKHCGVLPDEIIEECLYDSYDETRKMARRLKIPHLYNTKQR